MGYAARARAAGSAAAPAPIDHVAAAERRVRDLANLYRRLPSGEVNERRALGIYGQLAAAVKRLRSLDDG